MPVRSQPTGFHFGNELAGRVGAAGWRGLSDYISDSVNLASIRR
jgi:hypothetical protein